ncbi:MAG: arylsulfatase, partial [Planctomycetota bacterium]
TDDQGWGDLSRHGNPNVSTPNIDSLAEEGVSFRNFYVCSVCAPTRAEFLTARYHPRTGVSGVSRGEERLNPDETTIADHLKAAGYRTAAFGKWHNGSQPPYHPNQRGFDEFYGFTSGHWGHYFSPPLDHNGQVVRGDGYLVDDFTNHAIEFIEEASRLSGPFFCYLPLNTPHSPMMVPDEFYRKFESLDPNPKHRDPEKEDVMMTRAALAMVENIDWNVGRLLQTLRDLAIDEETIVVFFCDNGPNSFRWNGSMKGKKGSIDEGGLRSPLFIRWKGKIPRGREVDRISGAIDLLPTLLSLAGLSIQTSKPLDGLDLGSLVLGDTPIPWPDRQLFSVKRDQVSVRSQRFRLDSRGQLFDIENDRGQMHDVASNHPVKVNELKAQQTAFARMAKQEFARFKDRPFTVGYTEDTTLPARDGVEHGSIKRSSKAPNNSFFTEWTSSDGFIEWKTEVVQSAEYRAIVHYTCRDVDAGVTISLVDQRLTSEEGEAVPSVSRVVTDAFDPPLYDKSKERVAKSHYFVKDFRPLELGVLRLEKGVTRLRLNATGFVGDRAIDVHSIRLIRD